MPAHRLAVLNFAMSIVNHLSRVTKTSDLSSAPSIRVLDVLEDIINPSTEMLYCMLRGKHPNRPNSKVENKAHMYWTSSGMYS